MLGGGGEGRGERGRQKEKCGWCVCWGATFGNTKKQKEAGKTEKKEDVKDDD